MEKNIKKFCFSICKFKEIGHQRQKSKLINEVKIQVKNSKVICALSGGVIVAWSQNY